MEEAENGTRKRAPGNGVRKLSPSPTRAPSSEQRNPSALPPPPRVPRWLILDRIVHRSSRRRCGVVEDDATASRLYLRIAEPPAVSRLYLHLTGRPGISFRGPTAIPSSSG